MISVIIPTLNEEKYIPKTLDHLLKSARDPDQVEIIVVDSGSKDRTVNVISDFEAQVYVKPEFKLKKYASLNFGIHQAQGEILLFLDADTLLPLHFDKLIKNTLASEKILGGAFEFTFYPRSFRFKFVQFLNRIRYRLDGMYYGDQAIFSKKSAALEAGGFPENQLMDAAFFCKRLKRQGKLKLIKTPIETSARRFQENGFWKTFWFDFQMWIRFHFMKETESGRERYWSYNLDSYE